MHHYHLPASVCGIYVLTRAGSVAYVGRSVNIYSRLGDHARRKAGGYDELIVFKVTPSLVDVTEKNMIATFRPPLNEIQYKADFTRPCATQEIQGLLWSRYRVRPSTPTARLSDARR